MKKFTVSGTVTVPVNFHVEVEAINQEDAERLALEHVLWDTDYDLVDFDGNSVEFLEEDIVIDFVEELDEKGLPVK